MTMLEDALRQTFVTRTERVPVMDDPAGIAITRARVVRRRHRYASGTALVLTVLLMASGGWWIRAGVSGSSRTASAMAAMSIGLDVFDGWTIYMPNGGQVNLPDVKVESPLARVPAGFLYVAASGKTRLMRPAGSAVDTPISERFVVSDDGTHVAWTEQASPAGLTLWAGELTTDGLVGAVSAAAQSPDAQLVGMVDSKVLLSSGAGSDFWQSDKAYEPTWNKDVRAVYGAERDIVLGEVTGPPARPTEYCLALLNFTPVGLAEREHSCDPALVAPGRRALSPNGRYLAIQDATDVRMVDTANVFDKPAPAPRCASSSPIEELVWESSTRLLVRTPDGVHACNADGTVGQVVLPAGVGPRWRPVPRFYP